MGVCTSTCPRSLAKVLKHINKELKQMKSNLRIGLGVFVTFLTFTPISSVLADEFFYNASNGQAALGVFDNSGNFSEKRSYPVGAFSTGWSQIVNTPTGVFFYNASNGQAALGVFDSSGNFSEKRSYPVGTFSTGWSQIVNTPTGVFFYNASNGQAALGVFDSSGNFSEKRSYPVGAFSTGWTRIVEE
jgi:hypothetical protein